MAQRRPEIIVEFGSGFGVSGMYFAAGLEDNQSGHLYSFEINDEWADVAERAHWDEYMDAYQDALRATSKPWAPWYAIPADSKSYMRRAVADIVVDTMKQLPIAYPKPSDKDRASLDGARHGTHRARRAVRQRNMEDLPAPHPGLAFRQQRPAEGQREVHRRRGALVDEVVDLVQPPANGRDVDKLGHQLPSTPAA